MQRRRRSVHPAALTTAKRLQAAEAHRRRGSVEHPRRVASSCTWKRSNVGVERGFGAIEAARWIRILRKLIYINASAQWRFSQRNVPPRTDSNPAVTSVSFRESARSPVRQLSKSLLAHRRDGRTSCQWHSAFSALAASMNSEAGPVTSDDVPAPR